jgi:hypothetical protein
MGHKKVCLECKLTFNRDFDFGSDLTYPCPECQKSMILLPHRFRPPKKSDDKGWQLVKFLLDNGFYFQHIYQNGSDELNGKLTNNYVSYPKNLPEAKEFIITYKDYARNE